MDGLKSIAKKYSLVYEQNSNVVAQLSFAAALDSLLYKAKKTKPSLFKQLSEKDELIILDVGCGYFRYGKALYAVLAKINPNIQLFAIDKKKLCRNYSPATFVKSDVAGIAPKLSNQGIKNSDLLTVFNPFPGIPDLTSLFPYLRKGTPLIGCVDWNMNNFKESLKKNKFKPVIWQKNKFRSVMRQWFNNYDPFCFCTFNGK